MRYYELLESATDHVTAEQLLQRYPEIKQDLVDVGLWLKVPYDQLKYRLVTEPFSKFQETAEGMYSSYEQFPQDAKRAKKIVSLLKAGQPALPIFVDDDDGFLLEGRHRLVANLIVGSQSILVVYVAK